MSVTKKKKNGKFMGERGKQLRGTLERKGYDA
jgi:hypothetical protein